MQELYLRRIEKSKRVRLRVIVTQSLATVLIVSYLPAPKMLHRGSWLLGQIAYDLDAADQSEEYQILIRNCESCLRSEYRQALATAIRVNRLPKSLFDSDDFSEVLNNPTWNKDYPIPSNVLLKKIEDFLKSSGDK